MLPNMILYPGIDAGIFTGDGGDSDSKWTSLCSDSAILETNDSSEIDIESIWFAIDYHIVVL